MYTVVKDQVLIFIFKVKSTTTLFSVFTFKSEKYNYTVFSKDCPFH